MSNKRQIALYTAAYSVGAVLLLAFGLVHNQHAHYQQIQSVEEDKSSILTTILIIGLVYAVRSSLLLSPLLNRDTKWQRVLRYGIYFCIAAEVIALFSAVGLLVKKASDCQETGFSSPCDNAAIILVLALSTAFILQLVGMITGFLVTKFKK